jgi:geranylgeranyl pyrophosphate synthase
MPKPSEKEMEREMESLEHGLPWEDYAKDEKRLRQHIERLEKEYDEREKVISRIMEYGTGIETEKALRMYSTRALEKWEASLEKSYRAKAKQ